MKTNLVYRIVPNKHAGRIGRKRTLDLAQFRWYLQYELLHTLATSAGNLIEIGWVVAEVQAYKVKSRGGAFIWHYTV